MAPATAGEEPSPEPDGTGPAPVRSILLELAYEGTRYSGWQMQPGLPTVQGMLVEAIRSISGESTVPRGASRTDAGVHALAQLATFTTSSPLEPRRWLGALNARLPDDIAVLSAREVPPSFDPVGAALRKQYRYRIHDAAWRPVLGRRHVWRWRSRLDEGAMAEAAAALVGEHDFTSFETTPSTRISKVRTIYALTVTRRAGSDERPGAEVWVEVEGSGFLHNMVRIIVGSLVMVGCGRREPAWVASALAARSRPAAGPTAPPEGLVLTRIDIENPCPSSRTHSAP